MQALTVTPGVANSARVRDLPDPDEPGVVEVRGLRVGVCGTDREIVAGDYGEAPSGADYLVLGHEALGQVTADPSGTFEPGDLVVPIVRHPDPVPCPNCAAGEWDMCRNGRYTEHGIRGLHGFARERYRLDPGFAVRLDPSLEAVGTLLEPATVVAKAWDHLDRIGARARFAPRSVLVTGAGPVGLLAALFAAQRGLDVHVLDRTPTGPKPRLATALGATYHADGVGAVPVDPDLVLECTGVPSVAFEAVARLSPNGIACLAGVPVPGRTLELDGGTLIRDLVVRNNVVFGTVNANRRHYEQGAAALAKADLGWLRALITRRVPLVRATGALRSEENDVKVVIDVAEAG